MQLRKLTHNKANGAVRITIPPTELEEFCAENAVEPGDHVAVRVDERTGRIELVPVTINTDTDT